LVIFVPLGFYHTVANYTYFLTPPTNRCISSFLSSSSCDTH
jgi:hypothetical protein